MIARLPAEIYMHVLERPQPDPLASQQVVHLAMFRFALPRALPRILPTAVGIGLGASSFLSQRRVVLNEAWRPRPGESIAKYAEPVRGQGLSRLNGKLDYHQLTFGSFAGMVSGYFFGRISKILVGFVVTGLMATEYLAASGHIDMRPLYKSVYNWCLRHWHQEILVEDPSFKYSFSLAFIIAAYNA